MSGGVEERKDRLAGPIVMSQGWAPRRARGRGDRDYGTVKPETSHLVLLQGPSYVYFKAQLPKKQHCYHISFHGSTCIIYSVRGVTLSPMHARPLSRRVTRSQLRVRTANVSTARLSNRRIMPRLHASLSILGPHTHACPGVLSGEHCDCRLEPNLLSTLPLIGEASHRQSICHPVGVSPFVGSGSFRTTTRCRWPDKAFAVMHESDLTIPSRCSSLC